MRRQLQSVLLKLAEIIGPWLLRAWATPGKKIESGRDLAELAWSDGPAIVVFWHSRFLMLPFIYPKKRTIGVLISPSKDGDVMASVIQRLGREVVRGSSRRGGAEAQKEMENRLREGWDVGIAVDGPLGPAYECKMGPVRLAQKTGLPILPLIYSSKRGWALNSWDKFWIPAPMSTFKFYWGEPLFVQSDDDLPAVNKQLSSAMRALLTEAETWAKRPVPWAA